MAVTQTQVPSPTPSLADRLRSVSVAVRQDLSVSRHLFRHTPSYVVCDPMTFQSHRLSERDYQVFRAITPRQTLGQTFASLVQHGLAVEDDENGFYKFIFMLHRFNFLNLPISDDKLLYERHTARKKARRRQKIFGILFLRIPLFHPNDFLERTMHYVRPVFTRTFFALWVALMMVAGYVAYHNASQLVEPIEGMLLARNVALMWCVLIGLKLFHEFGHAYACKHFGGYVPEMGAFMILFTPCAYVDASASWSFTRRRDRLIVNLAGMYFESVFAAVALLVWALTPPGIVHDVAYNIIFLASVITVLFNINPLMRYDGYYMFSDLVEIPNVRQRSTRYVMNCLKHWCLRLPNANAPTPFKERIILFCYGIAASAYRVVIMLGIATLIATKAKFVGLAMGGFIVAKLALMSAYRLCKYLWTSEETSPVRTRAIVLSMLICVAIPGSVLFVPFRQNTTAAGIVKRSDDVTVHAGVGGFIERVPVQPGQIVHPNDPLVELRDDMLADVLESAETGLQASEIRLTAYHVTKPTLAQQETQRQAALAARRDRARRDVDHLNVRSPEAGQVVKCPSSEEIGRFVHIGEPLVIIGRGAWQVAALLSEDQFADVQPSVGDEVQLRSLGRPSEVVTAYVTEVRPAGSRTIESPALTVQGGGDIPVDPFTAEAAQSFIEVVIDLPVRHDAFYRHGLTWIVKFDGSSQSLYRIISRRLTRFLDALSLRQ
jgi:putative peptide zinc metalloprotease protein